MAKKHVVVYFMHEHEQAEAQQKVAGESTESYVIGQAEEADIAELRARGLIVQETPDTPAEPETPGRRAARRPGFARAVRADAAPGRTLSVEEPPLVVPPPTAAAAPPPPASGRSHYLLTLTGPLLESARSALVAAHVNLLESVPPNAYIARLTNAEAQAAAALPFVQQVRLYDQYETGPIVAPAAAPPPIASVGVPMQTWDVRLHAATELSEVLPWLQQRGVAVAGARGRKIRLYLLEGSPILDDLGALDAVAAIEQYVPPKLLNDVARQLLGVDTVASPAGAATGLTGAGQIVGIADTGLDDTHGDFKNRIVGVVALGRTGDASDPHGHGTHVAGSVLGDGSESSGAIRGAAPGARLFFQSLLDAQGDLGGLPLDLGELFEEAYQNGARIHNNSWGAATKSMYTINATEVDEFVSKRRDMLIVISAGNEGDGALLSHAQAGFVDWLSIGSPASAKNALVVGASRSTRTSGGYSQMKYGDVWPNNYPQAPISQEPVSGNREAIAAFSSRGPCDDHRIKPDVVAPGTDIVSTKSSRAPLRHFWGAHATNPKYAYMGGTSMAAPLVTGCAALVREFFTTNGRPHPSAALLKATLINGTRWLTGNDAVADHATLPNFHQGFGCVDLTQTVPHPGNAPFRLEVVDTWEGQPADQFTRTGQRFRFRVTHGGTLPLRVCLCWTDLPARGTQNSLSFMVEQEGGGPRWIANADLLGALTVPDPDNNVHVLRLDHAPAGSYLIQIFARNLLQGPQDYALVVSGDLTSPLVQV